MSRLLLFVFASLALCSPVHAQAVFKDLLPLMPEDSNALVLIHADKVRESVFIKEYRKKTHIGSQVDHHLIPREDVARLVQAAELSATLNPLWEVSVVETKSEISLGAMQVLGKGQTENLGTLPALKLDANAYLTKLGPKLYGVFGPANRQKAMRWAERATAAKNVRVSAYLSKIAEFPETAGTEIMLALDLSGMVDPVRVSQRLKSTETMKKFPRVDQDKVAQVLASLQGVALGVKVTDSMNAKLRVDFNANPAIMKDFAKPLLLEVLGDFGYAIDDFETWDVSMSDKTVFLGGDLTPSGLRRVLSLVDPPNLPVGKPESMNTPSTSLDPMALPSQRYFQEITVLLNDMTSRENAKYAKQAGWYDKYARKVSKLSMVNVDPEVLDYGQSVSMAFSAMAYNLRSNAAAASQFSNNQMTYWSTYSDWYSGGNWANVSWQTDPSERSKAEKLAKMYGTMSYADTVKSVSNSTAAIRRKMVEKYKIDF